MEEEEYYANIPNSVLARLDTVKYVNVYIVQLSIDWGKAWSLP